MYLSRESTRSETLHDTSGAYPLGHLKAEQQTEGMAANFETAQKKLEEANLQERGAYRNLEVAPAARDAADLTLDNAVRDLEAEVYKSARRDRTSAEYRRYFAVGLSEMVTVPLDREVAEVKKIESQLAELPANSPLQSLMKTPADARAKLEQAVQEYKDAVCLSIR